MADITIPLALFAGVVSFLSPCILPLVPAFISYLAGTSSAERGMRLRVFSHAVVFVLGFALVFALLGVLLTGALSAIAYDLRIWLARLGGIIIILFGLYLLGLFKISLLEQEHKLQVPKLSSGYLRSLLFGVAFAAGWTPCVGPVLGAILTLAFVTPSAAFSLLLAYALGLGIPFLLVGAFTSQASAFIARSERFMRPFRIAMGLLLIAIGILVFTTYINYLATFLFVPLGG